ncbi:hypothetical protein [uncultured Duncaniella sp.]|jgi:hypothetical protein|uniref:hypothetical protein n=1 Tax=uncultured Duncaniella sp. TaxID=2768039 RepID=UPI0011CE1A3C|nr:hypothetical protein [uncultured Duncaniella sp.]
MSFHLRHRFTKGIYGRAVHMGGSFYVLYEINICKKIIRQKRIVWLTDPKKLPGKISVRLFRTARPGLAVSEKIILASLRYFSRKPCITGVGRCNALVVHRAAKPGYSIIN